VDKRLDEMDKAFEKVQAAQGSTVKLPSAELNLLAVLEQLREAMLDALMATDRSRLTDIFGGSCVRLARIRAVLDKLELSPMNASDQRLDTCLGAIESCEQVLVDLGFTDELHKAERDERVALAKRLGEEAPLSDEEYDEDDGDDDEEEESEEAAASEEAATKHRASGPGGAVHAAVGFGVVKAAAGSDGTGGAFAAKPPDATIIMPSAVKVEGGSGAAGPGAVDGMLVAGTSGPTDISKRPGAAGEAADAGGSGAVAAVDGILVPGTSGPTDISKRPGAAGEAAADAGKPSGADGKKGHGRGGAGTAHGGGRGAGYSKGGGRPSGYAAAGAGKGYATSYDGVPVMMCMRGCGRPAAPGVTRSGRPFDTCCRGCAMGREHDVHCQRVDPRKVGEGLCKMGCGRKVAIGHDSSGQKLETCCHGCAIGQDHDEMCGKDVGDMFVPYIAITGDGFFSEARAVLDAIQLNRLLEHIRLLNRGQETPEEAIAKVNVLFLPGHPELAKSFEKMVQDAPKVKLEAKKGVGKGRRGGKAAGGRRRPEHGGKKDDGSKRKHARDEMRARVEDKMEHVRGALHRGSHGRDV